MNTDPYDKLYLIPVVNTTTETIPAFGVMRRTGTRDVLGRAIVAKPNLDSDRDVLVNGGTDIPAGGAGFGFFEMGDCPTAFDVADGTPVANSEWGSKAGSWLLAKTKTGFRAQSVADGKYVVVNRTIGGGASDLTTMLVVKSFACDSVGNQAIVYTPVSTPVRGRIAVLVRLNTSLIPVSGRTVTVTYGADTLTATTAIDGTCAFNVPAGAWSALLTMTGATLISGANPTAGTAPTTGVTDYPITWTITVP